ncbi:MAG: acetyl-CoA C-acyltransferase, partial [Candidatus Bathyarchaeota archaeon]
MQNKEIVIAGGVRTAIGKFGGSLKDFSAVQLGSKVIKEVLRRNNLRPVPPKENVIFRPKKLDDGLIELEKTFYDWDESHESIAIDEVIMGNVLQAGQG